MGNKNEYIRKKMYMKYQYEWLEERNYSIADIFACLGKIMEESNNDGEFLTGNELWRAFEETGFDGELFVSYEEFLDCEYRDQKWIDAHINLTEKILWLTDPLNQH